MLKSEVASKQNDLNSKRTQAKKYLKISLFDKKSSLIFNLKLKKKVLKLHL